ncbi:helix-turn-helix transcriptional regulator [Streptomyces sp. NPDC088258]|uniref:helix-turn-helix transcriptional regulator n=1 Tax=Streptomyces sp. NPDC088258 TaxID=3365849 RepID=UPI0037F6E743
MDIDWKALGREIRRAREQQGLTQEALAERAEVARMTLHSIESGVERKRIPSSLAKVERALEWPPGHAVDVLHGRALVLMTPADRDQALRGVVESAAIAVSDGLTSAEIRELSRRILEAAKERGLL